MFSNAFKHENYFYTSLGNSFVSDIETLECIKELIKKHNIRKIYIVLSNDNQIILDALGRQFFSEIKGLKKFYNEITKQKEHSEVLWQTVDRQFSVLSYYLNKKIKELQLELNHMPNHPIKMGGKIYYRHEDVFKDIYSNLICVEKHHLN